MSAPPVWTDVLAVNVCAGDVTPAGPVTAVESYDLTAAGLVCIKIVGAWHERGRRDLVSVQR